MTQLMHSFHGYRVPDSVLEQVTRGDVGAFCLFAFNVESPAQLRALTDQLRQAAQAGGQAQPIIGIDQEGGQLIAISNGATELPGNMALGATRSAELAEQAGRVLGCELLAMGVNLNFAPVLDINRNPDNPGVGIRSFGDDPQLVAELGVAMIRGIQAEGVLATAKHFPGHGDTSADSHYSLPVVNHDMERLEAVELAPFRAAVAANCNAILTAHVLFPALDSEHPATLSAPILRDLLREQMGYMGLIITDAMDMHAVSRLGAQTSVEAALDAGVDLVLLGHLPDQAQLTEAVKTKLDPASVARIDAARCRLPQTLPDLAVVGCTEHQAIAQTIADRSITVVRNRCNTLPLQLSAEQKLGIIYAQPTDLTPADTSSQVIIRLPQAIQKRHANTVVCEMPYQGTENDVRDALEAVAGLDAVLVGTINANKDPMQAELVRELHRRGQNPVVVTLRMPHDITAFPEIDTYVCAYSIREASMEAVARVIFSEIEATGTLPCAVLGILRN